MLISEYKKFDVDIDISVSGIDTTLSKHIRPGPQTAAAYIAHLHVVASLAVLLELRQGNDVRPLVEVCESWP